MNDEYHDFFIYLGVIRHRTLFCQTEFRVDVIYELI